MDFEILEENDWQQQVHNLKKRVNDKLKNYFIEKSNHKKNPVIDFLFEYYSFQFSDLKRWSPGVGVYLQGESAKSFLENPYYKKDSRGVYLGLESLSTKRIESLEWIITLMENIQARVPFFGCMGLHEWAMVYKIKQPRHKLPFRLSPNATNSFVEQNHIHCSHYDAFRFFTKEAFSLNELQPKKETRQQLEQPGCLHVNMDLYKWAHKFYPWVSSNLIIDTFDLAFEIRKVDMQASPYNVIELGYQPIAIETTEGKQQYISLQKQFYQQAQVLREKLIEEYKKILFLAFF